MKRPCLAAELVRETTRRYELLLYSGGWGFLYGFIYFS